MLEQIFLSICVVPVAKVPLEERYVVKKVRSIEGSTSLM